MSKDEGGEGTDDEKAGILSVVAEEVDYHCGGCYC